jgi:hypothetical protein
MAHYTPAPVTRTPAFLLAALALSPAATRAAGDKVGPETCRACHPGAYAAWSATPHARALEALPERSRKEARCLSCHAPALEDGITGVSCETCHGGGRVYAAAYVMRDVELARAVGLVDAGEKTCLGCHTDSTPSLQKFEYARKLALIAHGQEPPLPPAPEPRPAGKAAPATSTKPAPATPAKPGTR